MIKIEKKFPKELIDLNQWVGWEGKKNEKGKLKKRPIGPGKGSCARVNDPGTWASFDESLKCLEEKNFDGIGFVFTKDDPYIGIDLDHCIKNGEISSESMEIIDTFDSYTEISPSGNGIHIIIKGELPEGWKKNDNVEIYDSGRFFTMTGNRFANSSLSINDRTQEIKAFHIAQSPEPTEKKLTNSGLDQRDQGLIKQAEAAINGDKFQSLWNGYQHGYLSCLKKWIRTFGCSIVLMERLILEMVIFCHINGNI
jgi:putative DNA primase/helicase